MITLASVHARAVAETGKVPSLLKGASLTWERGVLAVIGTPADGTIALLEVVAGVTKVRGGRVEVHGVAPSEARSRIAYVPLATTLPDALRVDEVCELASLLRGEATQAPAARLGILGLEALARRRVGSLSPGEARGVSLALALTSKASVLLVEEPLAGLDAAAPARVVEALRARAAAGATVLVTSASVRDATRLGDQLGVFAHLPASRAHVGAAGAKLRVVVAAESTSEVSPFVAALAQEAAVTSVETAAYTAARVLHAAVAVVVSGPELLKLAKAVATAAARSEAKVLAIESAVMPLETIRAALAAPSPGVLPRPPPAAPVPPPAPAAVGGDA
ncbi:MAG TPA: ATP-binding cassette domain-containing protein [Labilithrix sp.]|nr:ATP-binding cassette domain-containing protein [Labilithrix sp.]